MITLSPTMDLIKVRGGLVPGYGWFEATFDNGLAPELVCPVQDGPLRAVYDVLGALEPGQRIPTAIEYEDADGVPEGQWELTQVLTTATRKATTIVVRYEIANEAEEHEVARSADEEDNPFRL